MTVVEDIVKLRSEFPHCRLVQHEHLHQHGCHQQIDVQLCREHPWSLLLHVDLDQQVRVKLIFWIVDWVPLQQETSHGHLLKVALFGKCCQLVNDFFLLQQELEHVLMKELANSLYLHLSWSPQSLLQVRCSRSSIWNWRISAFVGPVLSCWVFCLG